MSRSANAGAVQSGSRMAAVFVALMGVCAFGVVTHAVLTHDPWSYWGFASLLLVGGLTSRLKVKLPGVNGNMSVNLPFIFIAMMQLGLAEALLVAGVAVFTQCLPKRPNQFKPLQMFFNVCTGLVAAGLGWEIIHYAGLHLNPAVVLVMGCTAHLLVSTVAMAGIISLTESQNAWRTWSEIGHLSFPYYLASTGVASIGAAVGGHTGWLMLLAITSAMSVTYRSYRIYFNAVGSALTSGVGPTLQAKSAATAR
jgi:hypothetical protein